MLDMHEPDKGKHAQLQTEHIARQRILQSTEEGLQHHLERNARRETKRVLATKEAAATRREHARQAETHRRAHHAGVAAIFAKRGSDVAIAAKATQEEVESATSATTANAEMAFADA